MARTNWESHLIWKKKIDKMKDILEKSFKNMKRKELQSLANQGTYLRIKKQMNLLN